MMEILLSLFQTKTMSRDNFKKILRKIEKRDFRDVESSLASILEYSKKNHLLFDKKIKDTKKIIIKRKFVLPELLLGHLFDCCYSLEQKPLLVFVPTIIKILETNIK